MLEYKKSLKNVGQEVLMNNIYNIALSGMNAASQRMLGAAQNIANMSTSGAVSGAPAPYRPVDVISVSAGAGQGVTTQTVSRDPAYNVIYDPQSPFANDKGLVAQPNVDLTASIVDTIMARIAYQANAKVIEVAREKDQQLLNILR